MGDNCRGSSKEGEQQQQQQQQQQLLQQQVLHSCCSSSSGMIGPSSSMSKDSGAYDLAELDQALFFYLDGNDQSSLVQAQRQTLNIFPSEPMHVEDPSSKGAMTMIPDGGSSKKPLNKPMELTGKEKSDPSIPHPDDQRKEITKTSIKRGGNGKGTTTSSSEHEGPKTPDPKILRRLAQNREAARKSRLRKKAYIQQLESSRVRLIQLEQDLQRARSTQGTLLSGIAAVVGDQGLANSTSSCTGTSSEAAMFDVEYRRWLEEHHKLMLQLRAAVESNLADGQMQMFVEAAVSHYDVLMGLKGVIVRADAFHLMSGTWKTPAERCFVWIGDFRPSELIKVVRKYLEPLSEPQMLGIYSLQQSVHESEDALNQGLEAVHQSLSDTISSEVMSSPPDMATYTAHLSLALDKLASLEAFVRQADSLRLQTLHRLHQILTVHQAARCFLAIAEYFHRLRALSSLWTARPKQEGV
ncbi:transcription factor TGA2.1-like isoform X1 [Ananas comosus]|uniref:Transcription factor TGA2.1-like isoform X1 n=3 Tax=Ananas comosus TaxID=4615 RepID=A0A6P5GEI3_ANACO|nr:transcription factor TGA2.1-like isoform X1 [Ananas comosus]